MSHATTALLRRIEQEKEANRQRLWEERKAGERRIKNPRWAVDHLLKVGQISSTQHDAAHRYASVIERSQPGGRLERERVDGGENDCHAQLWDRSVAGVVARDARLFVLRSRSMVRTRMAVLDRLFAYDGRALTGPRPTMAQMQRSGSGSKLPYEFTVKRIASVLDLLDVFWIDRDRGYGR